MASRVGLSKLHRKRMVSGDLPASIGCEYTEGQAAALAVVARVVRRSGACHLGYDRIAQLAGISRSTVREGLKLAEDLGHIQVRRRPDEGETNVISIDFDAWPC
jgi:transcription initiation factor IIE alpha subunit